MKKCILILPYFGKFNNYFELFLKSCEKNSDFNWLIFTDDRRMYDYPDNVKVVYMEFTEFREIIQKKFDFEISLQMPYKLCDYKPSYGYVFQEYIKEYKFWGYCDCDIIFGKISDFLNEDMFKYYDRMFTVGHFSIFKNTSEINELFMNDINGVKYFEKVYKSNKIWAFDELMLNDIFRNSKFKFYQNDLSYNISVYNYKFRMVKRIPDVNRYFTEDYIPTVTLWNNGILKRYYFSEDDGRLLNNEYMYIHLQHRNMINNLTNNDLYQIVPNAFIDIKDENIDFSEFIKVKKFIFLPKEILKCVFTNIKWKIKTILRKTNPTKFTRANIN